MRNDDQLKLATLALIEKTSLLSVSSFLKDLESITLALKSHLDRINYLDFLTPAEKSRISSIVSAEVHNIVGWSSLLEDYMQQLKVGVGYLSDPQGALAKLSTQVERYILRMKNYEKELRDLK